MKDRITIAVSKGRILDESLPLLARAGLQPLEDPGTTRKLIFDTNQDAVRLIIIRAADVPTYVLNGGADLGIAGKDVLMECDSDNLYEPLDLKIACCRLMLAGPRGAPVTPGRLRVATKYVSTTRNYFAEKGQQVEIIKLYGFHGACSRSGSLGPHRGPGQHRQYPERERPGTAGQHCGYQFPPYRQQGVNEDEAGK